MADIEEKDPSVTRTAPTAEELKTLQIEKDLIGQITELLQRYKDANTGAAVSAKQNMEAVDELAAKFKSLKDASIELQQQHDKLNDTSSIYRKSLESDIEIQSRVSAAIKLELIKSYKELSDIQQQVTDNLKEQEGLIKKSEELYINFSDELKEIIKDKNDWNDLSWQERLRYDNNKEAIEKYFDTRKKLNSLETDDLVKRYRYLIQLQEEAPQRLAAADALNFYKKNIVSLNKGMDDFADALLLTSSRTNLLSRYFVSLRSENSGLRAMFTGLTENILNVEKGFARLGNNITNMILRPTLELDRTFADMNKRLGGFGEGYKNITIGKEGMFKTTRIAGLAEYGIGLKEYGDAYAGLSRSMLNFNSLSDAQREKLTTNAALLEKLGVSAEKYGSLTNKLMYTMNLSYTQAGNAINKLARDAEAAGINVSDYISEFDRLRSKLFGFADAAEDVYRGLQGISRATGGIIKADDLANFDKLFYGLEASAETIRTLTVAFGDLNLDYNSLVGEDPYTIAIQLKKAIEETGRTWDDLDIGLKNMLAGRLFGGDKEKLAAFMNQSSVEMEKQSIKQIKQQKEFNKILKQSVDLTSKFNIFVKNLAIFFEPVLQIANSFLDRLLKWQEQFPMITNFLAVSMPLVLLGVGKIIKRIFLDIFIGVQKSNSAMMLSLKNIEAQLFRIKLQMAGISTASANMRLTGAMFGAGASVSIGGRVATTGIIAVALSKMKGFFAKLFGPIIRIFSKFTPFMRFLKFIPILGRFLPFIGWIVTIASILYDIYEIFKSDDKQKPRKAPDFSSKPMGGTGGTVPEANAFNATTRKPFYTMDMATGRLKPVVKGAYNDEISIQASTPEERARETLLTLSPIQNSIEKLRDVSTNNIQISKTNQDRLVTYATDMKNISSATTTSRESDRLAEKIVAGISKINLNVNTELTVKKLVASLDPTAVQKIKKEASERGAAIALKAPYSKDTNLIPDIGV